MAKIVPLKPKRVKEKYKRHDIEAEYIPATKKWKYTITKTATVKLSDDAEDYTKAMKAAKKKVDAIVKSEEARRGK